MFFRRALVLVSDRPFSLVTYSRIPLNQIIIVYYPHLSFRHVAPYLSRVHKNLCSNQCSNI